MVVGLKRSIRIGRFVRVGVGNYFSARELVRVPEYNAIQEHQGKKHQDAIGDCFSYALTEEHGDGVVS